MPTYEFKCRKCLDENNELFVFETYMPIYKDQDKKEFNDISKAVCPRCNENTDYRVYGSFTMTTGMTLSEKNFGATKQRVETTKYLKEERRKRKREYDPGTRAHDSNELWTGNNVKGITDVKK